MFFVIPDALHDAINARLDAAIAKCPDAAKDREHLYRQLVAAFNEHGVIPEFEIAPVAYADDPLHPVLERGA